ncbi:MAG TPA: GlsB/YeaQ/YmgE family stress response membrane protein [Planctomycetota bacterium]|nr:GlsB/YeaQ/YmgE family stress response membrane protein [Planctomycetota bacterium]
MEILGWVLFGLVVGIIAKLLMPGRDPGGFIVTMLLGIAGSLIGGYIGMMFGGSGDASGWIGSILCAMLLLFLYRLIVGRRERHV